MSTTFELREFQELRNTTKSIDQDNPGISWPPESSRLTASDWLRESPGKRKAFKLCYGDMVKPGLTAYVADIGGGFSHITETLLQSGKYTLVDPLYHVSSAEADSLNEYVEQNLLKRIDWYDFDFMGYELVIANDIFPNVDFRLAAFLENVRASSVRELRLVLTVFYIDKFLVVQRVGSAEVLTVIPLSVGEICRALQVFCPTGDFRRIRARPRKNSDWKNGRYMYFLRFVR